MSVRVWIRVVQFGFRVSGLGSVLPGLDVSTHAARLESEGL